MKIDKQICTKSHILIDIHRISIAFIIEIFAGKSKI